MQNDFLTFACATGANVLTQAAYASASATATGYVTGTASSSAVNKSLRQSSIMSGMLAAFIAAQTSQDVIDDGTITTIETNFVAAIANVADNRIIQISDVVGLTTALNGKLSTTGNAASASKLASARTITLGGIATGAGTFDGSTNITINTSIADGALSIAKTSGLQTTLNALAPINNAHLTGVTTAQALTVAGSNVVTVAGFTTTSDANGSTTKFPDGTIISRGTMNRLSSTTQITFPAGSGFTQPPVVVATPINNVSTPSGYTFTLDVVTVTGVAVHQSGSLSCYWTAIGR
jgi:hypothetical protein